MGIESLITLIVIVLLVGLLFWALRFALAQMSVPQPVSTIILIVLALVVVLILLRQYGVL
jgi:hypothetical protein